MNSICIVCEKQWKEDRADEDEDGDACFASWWHDKGLLDDMMNSLVLEFMKMGGYIYLAVSFECHVT